MKRYVFVLGSLFFAAILWGNDSYSKTSALFGLDPNAGTNSFLTLLIPGGGKYEGMATAHTAVALDGGYMEANPAAGSYIPRTMISLAHVDWISNSALENLTFTFRPESLEDMGIGFNLKYLHVPFAAYNEWGSQYERYGGTASGWYSELIATSSISYNFLRSFYFGGLSIGASLKAGYRGVSAALEPGQNAISLMGDVGLMTQFNFLKPYAAREMNFSIGASIKNLGAEFIKNPDPLPTHASFGLAYKPLRPLTIAVDFNVPFNLDGSPAQGVSVATGLNADITSFLSAHTGVLIKTGKPRFTIGTDVVLKKMTISANYTLDLASQLELFDRMSVSIKIDLDTVRQLLIKDDVQALYLEGLEFYASGKVVEAITTFENCLALDPSYKPAREMLQTAQETLLHGETLRDALIE